MSEDVYKDEQGSLKFGQRRQDSGIIVKLELLHDNLDEMKAVLREMTVAINRLTLVEERQATTAISLERAFAAIKESESRISVLEISNVNTSRTSSLVDQSVWLLIAAFIGGILAYMGVKK